jgi:hypothetical protein
MFSHLYHVIQVSSFYEVYKKTKQNKTKQNVIHIFCFLYLLLHAACILALGFMFQPPFKVMTDAHDVVSCHVVFSNLPLRQHSWFQILIG